MKVRRVAKNFPVVCVGGSAGELDAYTRLLRHLPYGCCHRHRKSLEDRLPSQKSEILRQDLHSTAAMA